MNKNISKDQNFIAYCGLYFGDCHGFSGKIPDLAIDLRKELRATRYDKFVGFISTFSFGKDFKEYEECYEVLGAMVKFRFRKGCRNGEEFSLLQESEYALKKRTLKAAGCVTKLKVAKNWSF